MSDVAKQPGLFRRAGKYYYRKVVPKPLVSVLGTELRASLGTSDFTEAKARRNVFAAAFDERIRDAWASLSVKVKATRTASLSAAEIKSRIVRHFHESRERAFKDYDAPSSSNEPWRRDRLDEAAKLRDAYLDPHSLEARQDIEVLKLQLFQDSLKGQSEDTTRDVESLLLSSLVETEEATLAWLTGNRSPPISNTEFRIAKSSARTLAEVSTQYLSDYGNRRKSEGPKRPKKLAADHKLICEFFGPEILISDVSRQQCREFRDLLSQLPTNMSKFFPNRKIALETVIKQAAARKLPTLSYATQESYLRTLRMFLDWVKAEGIRTDQPSKDLTPNGKKPPAVKSRLPFKEHHLKAIFGSPLFSGCKNDLDGYSKPGTHKTLGSRAWIILISCFSGARLNEICQLRTDDFFETDKGQFFFRIDDSFDKRVKNATSIREVPIHKELLRLGILNLIGRAKSNGTKEIFFDIATAVTGYKSDTFTKWFSRFLAKLGVETTKVSYHSFRHTFQDAMRDKNLSAAVRGRICGWNEETSAGRNYGSGVSRATLHKAMLKVDLQIDLSHLEPMPIYQNHAE